MSDRRGDEDHRLEALKPAVAAIHADQREAAIQRHDKGGNACLLRPSPGLVLELGPWPRPIQ